MANQDEIIETTTEPEAFIAEEGIEADGDGTLETTYGALPVDDSFTSINIPFVANAPFAASRSLGSIPFGATTQGFSSGFSSRGYTSGYTSGYNSGFTSTMGSSNARSYNIPFQANTGRSYSGYGATTQGFSSGFSSRGYTSGYTSGYNSGFTSTMAASNSRSYTIPFKANTPSYSASPMTSAYSTMPTTATLGSSYATPMKASGPPTGNGAGASAFRNITAQRDSQLRTSMNNAITLRP
jgi:hypothetical protein